MGLIRLKLRFHQECRFLSGGSRRECLSLHFPAFEKLPIFLELWTFSSNSKPSNNQWSSCIYSL